MNCRYWVPREVRNNLDLRAAFRSYIADFGHIDVPHPELYRRMEVGRQKRVEGRNGGGPRCPGCKGRLLVSIDGVAPGIRQCGGCGTAYLMKVSGGLLKWHEISPSPLEA